MIGTFFDHYALPLVAPVAVVAARGLGRSSRLLIATLALGLLLNVVERGIKSNDGEGAYAVAALVKANSRGGCPYVFIGDTFTYELAGTCRGSTQPRQRAPIGHKRVGVATQAERKLEHPRCLAGGSAPCHPRTRQSGSLSPFHFRPQSDTSSAINTTAQVYHSPA